MIETNGPGPCAPGPPGSVLSHSLSVFPYEVTPNREVFEFAADAGKLVFISRLSGAMSFATAI